MDREYSIECVKIIEAWLDGKNIESRQIGGEKWHESAYPIWNFAAYEYRVKPVAREVLIDLYDDGEQVVRGSFMELAQSIKRAKISETIRYREVIE